MYHNFLYSISLPCPQANISTGIQTRLWANPRPRLRTAIRVGLRSYLLTVLLTGLLVTTAHAQSCPQYPATCPDLRDNPGSSDDSISRLDNSVLPCEIAMENRLRNWAAMLVNDIARKEKWDVAEIYEALGSGLKDTNGVVLAYERRPAHWVRMVWQFVVDKDSLRAWGEWLRDFNQRRLDQGRQYFSRANAKKEALQSYMDSAIYWNNQMAKYIGDHMTQYQKDLRADNKAGINTYEKGLDLYRRRYDYFQKKMADLQKDPQGEQNNADADKESNEQTIRFHDASVVVIEFDFNDNTVGTADNKKTPPPGSPPGVKWYTIPEPDLRDAVNYYTHSHNMAIWMAGSWGPKPNSYGYYTASWSADRNNSRIFTIKKIKSDKVQNLYVRVSGNAAAMKRILVSLSAGDMEQWITR
ncbi:MAG TPA: hypothetical protein VHD83_21000 [Puia sp.]|nr:hypothetical protein [Puia sp.]